MKRFLLFWIFVLMVLAVFAQGQGGRNDANGQAQRELNTHVTATQAKDVAYAFMNTGGGSKRGGTQSGAVRKQAMQLVYTGRATDSLTRATTDCYYVFALQPKGFVIVAADERVNPILGYSYDNDFVVENMPEQVRGWLGGYEKQIKTAIDRDMEPVAETTTKWSRLKSGQPISNTRNGNSVGPLLSTTWNQGQYYNSLCPTDANGPAGHVYTGCVATALAQIINYHQYPQHGRGTHSYSCNYGTLTVDYNSANYDYSNMPVSLTSGSTSLQVDAVATLMRDCGVAVNMGYAADESGAIDQEARAALINFFRYAPNMSFAEKAYFSNDEWETMLRNDLDAGNPVYYSGQGTGGHAFVCDGYNADGYFSFNFGWGGYCNGWYLTSNVNPGSSTFNDSQSAIFGITPDSTGNVILGHMYGASTFTVDEPLEFYHLMGHNAYEGGNYSNSCNSTVHFVPANSTNQIVADILDFEDQSLTFYDGNGNELRNLYGGGSNDLSPVVSSQNALQVAYSGNFYYAGFKMNISQTNPNECRMVSNITYAIEEITTVHLTWRENGTATQWQIEYGIKGFELGNGTLDSATTNTVTFTNLQTFTDYDFYIRSVCGSNQYGPWNKMSLAIDGPYWQDIVTSQPVGYVYDAATNSVQISTAEEFTWWAKTGNGIDGHLTADIDLSGYKWQPTALSNRNFNGHGRVLTNVYVKEEGCIFTVCAGGFVLENLGITNSYIQSTSRAGGLCGSVGGVMRNCYVSHSTIDGGDKVGGLVSNNSGLIINCYVNADVIGTRWTGLIVGESSGNVRNCYAAGTLRIRSWCYNAGIVAYAIGGEITNCYSVPTQMGTVGHIGSTFIADTSTFAKYDYGCTLLTPVVIDEITETDLLSALNRGLQLYNDSVYYTWITDTGNANGGYPVFGNKYVVQCPNPSDLSVQSIFVGDENRVILHWTENGNASEWRIRYRRHDRLDTAYTYLSTTSNPDTLYGIPLGYTYDFNVRAICDANHRSGWSESQTVLIDLPYWTDIVTMQPVGYVEDADGNVDIYSAEGLAWLAVKTNGFHGQQQSSFSGKTVTLKSDINIEGYRWYPICEFSGVFDGENHGVSNIYMNGSSGLFGTVYLGRVKNVRLIGGTIINGVGGLIGYATNCYELSNCHSSATVYSMNMMGAEESCAGSLCGRITILGGSCKVLNCSSSGTVYGRESCGSLIGLVYTDPVTYGGDIEINNCFATGNVNISNGGAYDNARYRGGLIGYVRGAHVNNCFSTGSVEIENSAWYGKVIGALDHDPHVHYIYGQDNINEGWNLIGNSIGDFSNATNFHHDGNTNILLSPISVNGTNHSDLLDALNAWVISQSDSSLRTWKLDTITGYPVFGDYFVPFCYKPTDLTVSQATVVGDATIKTRLAWTQKGKTDHWEVAYVAKGQNVILGTIVSVDSNSCVLAGIPIGQPLDFYVRAVCGENEATGWCGPVTYIPDKLRWTEVVTSRPEGFQTDANCNVYISTAEGLSWLSSILNGLHNDAQVSCVAQVYLTADIDLSAYRWTTIQESYGRSFNGNNHVVSGLYCNELSDNQGLFGVINGGNVNNLTLSQCDVRGKQYVGAIAGFSYGSEIVNCIVNGTIEGLESVGGLVGVHIYNEFSINYFNYHNVIENSCFIGNIIGSYAGGISGSIQNDTTVNCYVVCSYDDIGIWSGIFTATGSGAGNFILDCYYIENNVNLPMTSGNTTNVSSFSGSGTTWTLNTPPYINGVFHTDLVDALNAWVDANNTGGRYNRWAADTNMVNGGYPVFESVSLPVVTTQDTVMAQGYYSWRGMVFTSDTVLTDTLYTLNGYDSVVTYYIFVTPAPITEISIDTCSSYIWNGETYSKTGDYVQTFPSASGMDSIVVLHLTINPLTGVDEQTICDNRYTWIDGITYVESNNTATYTLQTADGCDSVVTLLLTLNKPTKGIDKQTACESFTWIDGNTYTQSTNEPTVKLINAAGCDSVVTLHLTISHSATTIDEQIACDSFTWIDGNTYTESTNEPTFTLTTSTGCDSVVTLHLIVNHTTYVDTTAFAHYSFDWYEYTGLTQSGNYTRTITNAEGCDSIITLHLTINDLYWTDVVTSQPNGYQEDDNGNVFISSAEGLAWLSCVVNELNGAQYREFNHVVLTRDIDLSAYLWKAIGSDALPFQCASFNGNNHVIAGLNCHESNRSGLFGFVEGGVIHDLALTQCEVNGRGFVGIIAGVILGTELFNCMANGNVSGRYYVGGLVGQANINLENSCFIGMIDANHSSGGICGIFAPVGGGVVNCYVVNETAVEGMITGTDLGPDFVANCYYQERETSVPITSSNCAASNNSGFTGGGYTWTLNTPPYINGTYHTDLVCALNAWVDSSNTEGRYCRWVADTAMVNGGYPVFEAMSYPVIHDTVTAHESYSWHDMVFTSDTVLADTILTSTGYFNVLMHHLMVYHPVHTAITVNTCDGYSWGETTYNTSGDYTYSHLDVNGCTQVDTLHLTVRYSTTGDTTATACDSFDWYEHTGITQSCENLMHFFTNETGCDSIVTLHLTVNHSTHNIETMNACESYVWHGETYTTSGIYTFNYINTVGCASTDTLHLTVNHTTYGDTTAIVCDSFDWYEHPGITLSCENLTHTFTNAAGCDSIVTLHLTINHTTYGDTTAIVCDSFDWYEHTGITLSCENLTHTFTNASGCDSVVTLHLTIGHSNTGDTTAFACNSFTWYGTTYTETPAVAPTHTFTNASGCDSVVTLHLTIGHSNTGDTTAFACNSFTWYGTTYTETPVDAPTHTFANASGCDSVVTLHLTVGHSNTGDTTAVACESFTWYDTTYTETPTVAPTHTLTNASGCDSVVTLHLTINTSVAESVEATACDSYIWNEITYTESGDYTQSFTAANGCDSVVTLHLTVNPSVTIEAYLTISENDLPYTYGDTTFMPGTVQSGDYTFNFTTTDGCDSVIILHLTVETGINDYSLNASMKLYPNPTKDLVNVQLTINNEQLDDVVIQLFDVYGKMLDVIKLQSGTSLQTQIDLSRYANGVYLIKAVAEGNVLAVRKVVKR